MYHHGASPTSDEHNFGELTTDAAGVADDEVTRVYHHGDFCNAGNDDNVGELNTDAAGAADDDDTGVYHHEDFRDAGYEDNVGELNNDAAGVADDDHTGLYHHEGSALIQGIVSCSLDLFHSQLLILYHQINITGQFGLLISQ